MLNLRRFAIVRFFLPLVYVRCMYMQCQFGCLLKNISQLIKDFVSPRSIYIWFDSTSVTFYSSEMSTLGISVW